MRQLWQTLGGKVYLGLVVGSIVCELFSRPLFIFVGLAPATASSLDTLVSEVALPVLALLLLWIAALLARRNVVAAMLSLVFAIAFIAFFFGKLGAEPNLLLTALFLIAVGGCVWWAVTRSPGPIRRPTARPQAPSRLA